jgi:hypothetical protein
LKLFQEWGGGDKGKQWRGVNSIMIYSKYFCKCHNLFPVQQYLKKERKPKNITTKRNRNGT